MGRPSRSLPSTPTPHPLATHPVYAHSLSQGAALCSAPPYTLVSSSLRGCGTSSRARWRVTAGGDPSAWPQAQNGAEHQVPALSEWHMGSASRSPQLTSAYAQ